MNIFEKVFTKPSKSKPLSGKEEVVMQKKFANLLPHASEQEGDRMEVYPIVTTGKKRILTHAEMEAATDTEMKRIQKEAIQNGIHFLQENNDDIVFSLLTRPDGSVDPEPHAKSIAAEAFEGVLSECVGHWRIAFNHVFHETIKNVEKLGYRRIEENEIGKTEGFIGHNVMRVTLKKVHVIE